MISEYCSSRPICSPDVSACWDSIDKEAETRDKVSLAGNCLKFYSIIIILTHGEVRGKPFGEGGGS
jgi:hypothetical protein